MSRLTFQKLPVTPPAAMQPAQVAPLPAVANPAEPKLQDLILPEIRDEIIHRDSEYGAWLKDRVREPAFVKYGFKTVKDLAQGIRRVPLQIAGGLSLMVLAAGLCWKGAELYSAGQVQLELERAEQAALEARQKAEQAAAEVAAKAQAAQREAALSEARAQFQNNYLKLIPTEYQALFASEFIYIEGGTFQMGSADGETDETVHSVTVSSFAMQVTEMTNAQYQALMGSSPSPSGFNDANQPVVNVTWTDADTACHKLGGRLPTEAEFELAATNYGKSKWAPPEGVSQISTDYANYGGNVGLTKAVKSYKPTALGLYDLSGNVWEWVGDWYGPYPTDLQIDPTGPASGDYRVIRGGAWSSRGNYVRGANRSYGAPGRNYNDLGFRCILSLRT